MTESIPVQSPLIGLNMDSDTAKYVGMLEGTLAALCINEVKYRALLEILTGESWEETRIDFNGKVLMELAASTLVRQTGMSLTQAKTLVFKRWHARNHAADIIVPKAIDIDTMMDSNRSPENSSTVTASERLQAWKEKQLADAAGNGTNVP